MKKHITSEHAASALVALLLCPFAAPMLLSLAGSALICLLYTSDAADD